MCNCDHWVSVTKYKPFSITGPLSAGATAADVANCYARMSSALSNFLGGISIAIYPNGEGCCHCHVPCNQCICSCLSCCHLHTAVPTENTLVIQGFVSENCALEFQAQAKLRVLAAALTAAELVAEPQVTFAVPLPAGQFKIMGKLGDGWNAERKPDDLLRNELLVRVHRDLVKEGKIAKVSDLVRSYLDSQNLGTGATAVSMQVKLADVYYKDPPGYCNDFAIGHVITGSIVDAEDSDEAWVRLRKFAEFLAARVADASPIHVVFDGIRQTYSPPWPIDLLRDFGKTGWRTLSGKTW